MSLSLRAGRAALAEDMGMTLLPRTHPIMALCCWRCALSCALCDERGDDDELLKRTLCLMYMQAMRRCRPSTQLLTP